MNKSRVTVLLGAGAMCDCTQLNTKMLTELASKKEQDYFDSDSSSIKTYPLLAEIKRDLEAFFKENEGVSFEDMFHVLEMMDSYESARRTGTVKQFKSIFPLFSELKSDYAEKLFYIYKAKEDLIDIIIEEVAKYEGGWRKAENKWFKDFFNELGTNQRLDVFSLNYDTWLEQLFEDGYSDGYIPMDDEYGFFSSRKVFNYDNSIHSINHLHGQVCFTTHHPTYHTKYIWEDQCRLLKAKNYDTILSHKVSPSYSGTMPTQSGEQISSFPIITGLRKTEKIMIQPFDAYFHHFYQSVMQNNKLLVIGYSFGDLYINSVLEQFSTIHGDDGRAVIINYLDKKDWTADLYDNKIINHNTKHFYYHLYRETDLDSRTISWNRPDFFDSKNGTKSIYTIGFRQTAEHYIKRLLETLESS